MKTWIIARGPDNERVIKGALEAAESIRKGEGVVVVNDAKNYHIDTLPDRSVSILCLQDDYYDLHVIDERKSRFVILALGVDSAEQALRLTQGMQELGPVAVMGKSGIKTFPEGTPPEECYTVIVDYPSPDNEIKHIVLDSEAYYGWLPSRKLSGKKI